MKNLIIIGAVAAGATVLIAYFYRTATANPIFSPIGWPLFSSAYNAGYSAGKPTA